MINNVNLSYLTIRDNPKNSSCPPLLYLSIYLLATAVSMSIYLMSKWNIYQTNPDL